MNKKQKKQLKSINRQIRQAKSNLAAQKQQIENLGILYRRSKARLNQLYAKKKAIQNGELYYGI